MQPHQERVVNEEADLRDKIEKLTAFLRGDIFTALPEAEQERLLRQLEHMSKYDGVLIERIDAFKVAA